MESIIATRRVLILFIYQTHKNACKLDLHWNRLCWCNPNKLHKKVTCIRPIFLEGNEFEKKKSQENKIET